MGRTFPKNELISNQRVEAWPGHAKATNASEMFAVSMKLSHAWSFGLEAAQPSGVGQGAVHETSWHATLRLHGSRPCTSVSA